MKNKILYTIPGLILFLFLSFSCSNEKPIVPTDQNTVYLDLPFTRAGDPTEENRMATVRMIVVQSGTGKVVVNTTSPYDSDIPDQTWHKFKELVPVGYIDIYIFANELSSWGLSTYTVGSTLSLAAIKAKTLDLTDYPEVDASHFIPMFLYHEMVKIDQYGDMTKGGVPLTEFKVVRIFSKLQLNINCRFYKLPDFNISTNNYSLILDSVYIRRMPKTSWLVAKTHDQPGDSNFFDGTYLDPSFATLTKPYAYDNPNPSLYDDGVTTDGFYHEYVLYLPEYIIADVSKFTYLVITAHTSLNPTRFHYKLVLGNGMDGNTFEYMQTTTDPADLTITRNTWYTIKVTDIIGFGDELIPIILVADVNVWQEKNIPVYQ